MAASESNNQVLLFIVNTVGSRTELSLPHLYDAIKSVLGQHNGAVFRQIFGKISQHFYP